MSAETRGIIVATVVLHEISLAGQQWTGPVAAVSFSPATTVHHVIHKPNTPYTFILRKLDTTNSTGMLVCICKGRILL